MNKEEQPEAKTETLEETMAREDDIHRMLHSVANLVDEGQVVFAVTLYVTRDGDAYRRIPDAMTNGMAASLLRMRLEELEKLPPDEREEGETEVDNE